MKSKKNKKNQTRKAAKNKPSPKKRAPARKKSPPAKKALKPRPPKRKKRITRDESESVNAVAFEPKGLGSDSAGQSGDLQGLSNIAGADSESVDELLEEGNAYEAEVIEGVENAPDPDRGELRTREVPEDDVPEEYLNLDKDQ
jgi:hypothetical protein